MHILQINLHFNNDAANNSVCVMHMLLFFGVFGVFHLD